MAQAAGFCRTCNTSYVLGSEEENVFLPLCARCELLHRGCAVLCRFFNERSASWRIAYTQVPYVPAGSALLYQCHSMYCFVPLLDYSLEEGKIKLEGEKYTGIV